MAVTTQFSGYVRRYDGTNPIVERRVSVSKSVTEGGFNQIRVSPGSSDVSIMPRGLIKATSLFVENSGNKAVNIAMAGDTPAASMDILSGGVMYLNGSLNAVSVSNQNATGTIDLYYDITG